MKEVQGAYFNDQPVLTVDSAMVEIIKERAVSADSGRFRLCLHHATTDAVQQMIIACTSRSYSRPHRHPGRVLSYQMIEGCLIVALFDEDGRINSSYRMGGNGPFYLWLGASQWYMPVAETETAVFCEVLEGPNPDGEAVEWAPWAPEEGEPDARQYYADIRKELLGIHKE